MIGRGPVRRLRIAARLHCSRVSSLPGRLSGSRRRVLARVPGCCEQTLCATGMAVSLVFGIVCEHPARIATAVPWALLHVAAANSRGRDAEPGARVQMYSFGVLPDRVYTPVSLAVCAPSCCVTKPQL